MVSPRGRGARSSAVLVTGAGGFVGSAVVRQLAGAGSIRFADGTSVEHVAGLVRPGGSLERLETLAGCPGWSVAHVDLEDVPALRRVLAKIRPRAVVHAALEPSAVKTGRVAADVLEALLEGLTGMQGARFIHTGSAWVLRGGVRLAEDAATEPLTNYARAKLAADELLGSAAARYGVEWVNLRLFNLFGRYEAETRLLPYAVERLSADRHAELSSGRQLRDFNDVDDVAVAFERALAAPSEACGSIYHIGSGRATAARDFASMIATALERPDLLRFGATRTTDEQIPALVADPTRAATALGWEPNRDLEDRVRRAVEWWWSRRRTAPVRSETPSPGRLAKKGAAR